MLLFKSFFPSQGVNLHQDPFRRYSSPIFEYKPISDQQITWVIAKMSPYKATGPSGLSNAVLTHSEDLLTPHLDCIYPVTFNLNIFPQQWKTTTTAVLQKPNKPNYMVAKAYRPITLIETLAKPLLGCIAEKHRLLPDTNFGGCPGRSTTDALHLTVKFIFDNWRKGNVVSALFLDVTGAFSSVEVQRLMHNMRMKGVPQQYTNWVLNRLQGHQTKIQFDDYLSDPLDIDNGCDQGDPTSVILYHFYNAGLIDVANKSQAELAPAFIDNVTFLAAGPNFMTTHTKIHSMMMRENSAHE